MPRPLKNPNALRKPLGAWAGCHFTIRGAWYDNEREHLVAFGDIIYESGAWSLEFGLRLDPWEQALDMVDTHQTGFVHSNSTDDTEVLRRLTVSRRLGNDSMVYAGALLG